MKKEHSDEESRTVPYRTIGLMLQAFALVFLVAAAILQGTGKSQLGTRFVLIIIGVGLLFSGATLYWAGKFIFTGKTEHHKQKTAH